MSQIIVIALLVGGSLQLSPSTVQIFLDDEGGVRFGGTHTDTGLSATPEAQEYPEAVKQLIAEEKEFVPVEWKSSDGRMIGFLTWEKKVETTLIVAREGQTIVVRPPEGEAERAATSEQFFNPLGLLVLTFFGLLLYGNLRVLLKGSVRTGDAFGPFIVIWIIILSLPLNEMADHQVTLLAFSLTFFFYLLFLLVFLHGDLSYSNGRIGGDKNSTLPREYLLLSVPMTMLMVLFTLLAMRL